MVWRISQNRLLSSELFYFASFSNISGFASRWTPPPAPCFRLFHDDVWGSSALWRKALVAPARVHRGSNAGFKHNKTTDVRDLDVETMKVARIFLLLHVLSTTCPLVNAFDPFTTTLVIGATSIVGRKIYNFFHESCDPSWIAFNATGKRVHLRFTWPQGNVVLDVWINVQF